MSIISNFAVQSGYQSGIQEIGRISLQLAVDKIVVHTEGFQPDLSGIETSGMCYQPQLNPAESHGQIRLQAQGADLSCICKQTAGQIAGNNCRTAFLQLAHQSKSVHRIRINFPIQGEAAAIDGIDNDRNRVCRHSCQIPDNLSAQFQPGRNISSCILAMSLT